MERLQKIPLVGFQDIRKTDLQNSFRPDRAKIRGVSPLVTQILSGTRAFQPKPRAEFWDLCQLHLS